MEALILRLTRSLPSSLNMEAAIKEAPIKGGSCSALVWRLPNLSVEAPYGGSY